MIKHQAVGISAKIRRCPLLFLLVILAFSACNEVVVTKSMRITAIPNLRMREEPSITSNSIAFPKYGELVESLGEVGEEETHDRVRGRWSKIIYNGKEGYVFGGFLKEAPGAKKPSAKPVTSKKNKTPSVTPILIWSGIGIVVLIGLSILFWKRRVIFSNRRTSAKSTKKKQDKKSDVLEIKKNDGIKDMVQVWFRTGEVMGSSKRSETHVSGGGSVRDGSGSVSVSSWVTVKHDFFIKQANGEEYPIQMSGLDIPLRDGQNVSMIYVAKKNVDRGYVGRLVNYSANKFYNTEKARRLLKFLGLRAETSIGTFLGLLIGIPILAVLIAGLSLKAGKIIGVSSFIASLIYIVYHTMAESLGSELDKYLDALAQEQLSKGRNK